MSEGTPPVEEAAPSRPRRWRWSRRILVALVGLVGLVASALALLDTSIGHRLIAEQVAALKPANGLRFRIGRIEGSIYSRATLRDLRIYDPKGLVFQAPTVELDWRPFAWLDNRLQIERIEAPRATLAKLPQTIRTGGKGPILPGFDIRIGALRIGRLAVAKAVTGVARTGSLQGRADVRSGRALIDLAAVVQGSDRLRLRLDAAPDTDGFDFDVSAAGAAKGVLAQSIGIARPIALEVHGDGDWKRWSGNARMDAGGVRIATLALGNRSGSYTLAGVVAPGSITQGRKQRLTNPNVRVSGAARLASRRLTGSFALRSRAIDLRGEGALDLANNAYRDVHLTAHLLQPPALFLNMTGRNIELRAILDGPFATARFDYRLFAERMTFDNTGFEQVRAGGAGRFSPAPVKVPLRFTAARVTGVGDVAGGILRNLSLDGVLDVTARSITGNNLRLSSNQLQANAMLSLDLRTGSFEITLAGGMKRYLIPGLGIVEVDSRLRVVPGAGGHGTNVVGVATAQMIRLDNAFFRSLTGGLPRIVTGLVRGPDQIVHFNDLVLTSPLLRLAGNGYRRRDGTFHFEGGGTHVRYGPVTLVLDGKIDHPTLDLKFTRPNEAMGLREVRAHLDPTDAGFAFTTEGGSRLGGFTGAGAILLPKGGTARIAVERIDVGGTRGQGTLAIVEGGFDGRIELAGGGISGALVLAPQGEIQRIEGQIRASSARVNDVAIRRGRLDFTLLLDPDGAIIDATATAQGIRRGSLSMARLAANLKMKGGEGELRASLAGSRGRGFNIQTVTQIAENRYSIEAQGTVDRREIKLTTPAVLVHEGDQWRLQPTQLNFAGGEARLSGAFGGGETAIDATLTRMPLSVLDIGYPGLGLGGTASGRFSYAHRAGGAPTGRVDMTVRGMTRSGLVLSSAPIDVGFAGILEPGTAAMRAVMASGGKTIGRAQARISPLGSGTLTERLRAAPLFAQLRYDGPADTLWRLTGIELFDLSGPVAIGADFGGRVDNPIIRGSLRTDNARLQSAVTGMVLQKVQASGRFDGSRLVIDRFAASDGRTGSVSGTGSFDFAAAHGVGMDLSIAAQNAVLINRDDIGATVTGPLSFRSDGSGGLISGEVRLNSSRYRLGRATAATAVPRFTIREINLPFGGGDEEDTPAKPWRLDIRAHAAGNMNVTGLGLSSEWSGDLQIAGLPENPSITGRADLIRGDFLFAGREFTLERGIIRFDGSVPANPALDISANADETGLSATIRVTGTSERPEIGFTSTPTLPEDELLSRLLFGTSITNLSAPEALQLASAVAALQNPGGGLDPINAVRRVTGLDRLRVLPPDSQTGQGTAVAAGKYVTRRTYAEIISDGQGYSATRVEFQVTRWLSLLATISTIGRQSANVRVSKDY